MSGSEPKKRATTQGAGHLMTKRKKPKNSKKNFRANVHRTKKPTGSKTSDKTEITSRQQMLAFLRKDIRQNF